MRSGVEIKLGIQRNVFRVQEMKGDPLVVFRGIMNWLEKSGFLITLIKPVK